MNLYLFDLKNVIVFSLPNKVIGNFWLTDADDRNVVNISAVNDEWVLSGSNNTKINFNGAVVPQAVAQLNTYYVIEGDRNYILLVTNEVDNTFKTYTVNPNTTLKISGDADASIGVNIPYLGNGAIVLDYQNNNWFLKRFNNANVYVNNKIVMPEEISLLNGDVINIYGQKIIVVYGLVIINNLFGNLRINNSLSLVQLNVTDEVVKEEIENVPLYKDTDYFLRSPRMRRNITTFDLRIDSPPQKENMQEMPLFYTLGPMLTMGASSMVFLITSLMQVESGDRTFKEVLPTLVISASMLLSMLVWPFLTRNYEKKRKVKREEERQNKYRAYLEQKRQELVAEYNNQVTILGENLLTTDMCYDIILNKRRTLWERKIDQNDFLTVRVGSGPVSLDAKISYQEEDFTMEDDNLKKSLQNLVAEYSTLNNAPVGYNLAQNNITAIVGLFPKYLLFTHNMILQLMAYHSYDALKIVVFTNKNNQERWEYLKNSLYCFSDDKKIRFFATNTEEMQDISDYLKQVFDGRKALVTQGGTFERVTHYSQFRKYYLIIIDDIDLARKISFITSVLEERNNLGFSLLILCDKLSKLPSECNNFINIGNKSSGILKDSMESNDQVKFIDEIKDGYDMMKCVYTLSNLPIYIENNSTGMPETLTFLEMFGVGQVEQLNSLNRWHDNNPTKTLKTSVGVNENGDLFMLDLHEKYHGPHGLIAGMTGSGKSEFLITYILSMAVNYSPEEVSFVLIDYKGGGLAGAFEDVDSGKRLPHIVGTITNLDKAEINRALSSINSELRRRQLVFNSVRDKMSKSTVDIYKYQRMYREGLVEEPMPHLIIISDEFAELKNQQPEFMEDLISAARIGRSLGVHLILATQKPAGVVDAQIWSNSKFKICLKVQDKADSIEMIKSPLAAEIKEVGRFYLQVGYNEYFAKGQSAWAGASYYPSKEFKKQIDKNIYFINNTGSVVRAIENSVSKELISANGEELSSILKYLIHIGSTMNLKVRKLWMEKLSTTIFLGNLIKKYNYQKIAYVIDPIIGEYDNPAEQIQGILTLPLTRDGNALIYGIADSGKDEFMEGLTYSLISTYSTDELNLYLLDFGSEVLVNFNGAPQVGDVILNGDDEKVNNLVKMLLALMNKRKKMFVSYNGNYQDYIKLSGKKLPNIVVLINSIEVMTEIYDEAIERLTAVIREGSKYGINFVVTTASQSSIRYKIAQCFKTLLCLQLTNESDYRDILGKTDGLIPSKVLGRGLVKVGRVCEFQTISIAQNNQKYQVISELITKLNQFGFSLAKSVPVMPDVLTVSRFSNVYNGADSVPLGLTRDTLVASLYDYTKNSINIISANELDNIRGFMLNYMKVLESNNHFKKIVIDANNYFDEFKYQFNYYNNNFNSVVDYLKQADDKIQDVFRKNNMNIKFLKYIDHVLVIIVGIEKFIEKLDSEHKDIFYQILNNQRETLKLTFVFIDNPNSFKKYEYDDWYKDNVDSYDGLWIGEGVGQQYAINVNFQPNNSTNIDNDYGIVVTNGMPVVIKLINEIKK